MSNDDLIQRLRRGPTVSDEFFDDLFTDEQFRLIDEQEPVRDAMREAADSIVALRARVTELEAALLDFAEHGLRHDLNPTMASVSMDGMAMYAWFSEYMTGADRSVRARAATVLASDEPETTDG